MVGHFGRTVATALRAAAIVLACAITLPAWAQSDADVVAQGESLVRAGRFAEAYKLLEPLEDRLAGNLKFDYLLARSALESGYASKASFIYERILAVEPNYVGVRLEMGRAYLALGDYARAKLEFETVLRFENLPADLRQQAEIYGKAADEYISGKKTVAIGYLEYSYGYDSNPQSVTRISPVELVAIGVSLPIDPPRGDHYQALTAGGEVIHALSERTTVFAGGDARARKHREIEAADWGTLDGRFGFGYSAGAHNTRVALTAGRFWLDDTKTRDSGGMTLDYRYLVSRQDQLTVGLNGSRNKFLTESLRTDDYDLYQGTLGWLHGAADGRGAAGLSLVFGAERETEGRIGGDKAFAGLRVTLQRSLTSRLGAFLLAGAQRGVFSEVNPLFGTEREDELYDVVTGVSWSIAKGWSLRGQLLYLENDSNQDLYEYDRTDVSLNLRVDF
jgi:tetratricopeptide (TPR) repeat protein